MGTHQTPRLSRLIYYSRNVLPGAGDALRNQLRQIVESAIRNNAARGVTGGLVFNHTHFLQVLEGDAAALTETFSRLCNDTRHENLVLVEMKPIARREFGRWSMGFTSNIQMFERFRARHGMDAMNPAMLTAEELFEFVLAAVRHDQGIVHSDRARMKARPAPVGAA